jgi:hypothetical protein
MASQKSQQDLIALRSAVETTSSLLDQIQQSAAANSEEVIKSEVNAIDLAHDTASLIRAQITKLSLLIINKPFTASEITRILRYLIEGPLPGLSSAVQRCTAAKYTKCMSTELQWRAGRVFTELAAFSKAIPLDGNILTNDEKNGTSRTRGKGSLASTGVVWEACDAVMELKSLGVAGLVVKKAEGYRDLLKDALEELQEWGEEEDDEDKGLEDSGDDEDGVSRQEEIDKLFGSQRHIPLEDPDKIRPRLDSSQKRLRLIITMYTAVVKRRFKTLPRVPLAEPHAEPTAKLNGDPGIVSRLDEVLAIMKKIPETTDDLASAFYDLDGKEIDTRMDDCFLQGFAAAEFLATNWDGQKDEFSTWVGLSVKWMKPD